MERIWGGGGPLFGTERAAATCAAKEEAKKGPYFGTAAKAIMEVVWGLRQKVELPMTASVIVGGQMP